MTSQTVLESHRNGLTRQKSTHVKVHNSHGTIKRKQSIAIFPVGELCILKQYTNSVLSHKLP